MRSNAINSQTSETPRKWNWTTYVSLLTIGVSVFILCVTGFSKIVLISACIVSIVSTIYFGLSSRQWAMAGFFAVLGVTAFAVYVLFPQSSSPFGWDKIVSMFLGAVTSKVAFIASVERFRRPTPNKDLK